MSLQGGRPAPAPPARVQVRRVAVAVAVVAVVFGFALPRLADYGETWAVLTDLSAPDVAMIGLAGAWNLVTYWPVLVLALPGLRLAEAAVVNQASTAVANTVPAGGALALGVSFRMLRAWGFSTRSITGQVLVTGVWNNLVKLALPMVAVVALAITGEAGRSSVGIAAGGITVLGVVAVLGARVLADDGAARRLGGWLDAALTRLRRGADGGRTDATDGLVALRSELVGLVRSAGPALSAAAVVSHLSLYLVLLVSLRAVGVGNEEVSWAVVLAAFAFVRFLSALPVTPGGLGIVELGYVAFLTASTTGLDARVAAGVLVFRAVTFALPVGLGALAWLVFATRSSWRRPPASRSAPDVGPAVSAATALR